MFKKRFSGCVSEIDCNDEAFVEMGFQHIKYISGDGCHKKITPKNLQGQMLKPTVLENVTSHQNLFRDEWIFQEPQTTPGFAFPDTAVSTTMETIFING
jgi:hypothetical protein